MSVRMLSVHEVAALIAVSPMTVYRLIDRGELTAYRIGRVIRVRGDDLASFMRANEVRPS